MATAPPHIHPTPEVMSFPSFLRPHLSETRQVLIFVFIIVPAFCLLYYSLGDSDSKNGTSGSGKGKPVVALAGAPDAGKTTIFSALALQQQPQTHTSLTSSSSIITVPSSTSSGDKALTLVDLPGHRRMREQTQRALRDPKLKGVVFVVDVAALIRNGAMVAEELVPILTTLCAKSLSNQTQSPPKLLIMGNKSDLLVKPTSTQPGTTTTTTHPPNGTLDAKTRALARERLESLLTRELSRAKSSRASRTGRIESIDAVPSSSSPLSLLGYLKRLFRLDPGVTPGAGVVGEKEEEWKIEQAEDAMWGERNGTFRFEEVEGVDIEFAVGSAVGADGKRSEQDGLGELRDWLSEL